VVDTLVVVSVVVVSLVDDTLVVVRVIVVDVTVDVPVVVEPVVVVPVTVVVDTVVPVYVVVVSVLVDPVVDVKVFVVVVKVVPVPVVEVTVVEVNVVVVLVVVLTHDIHELSRLIGYLPISCIPGFLLIQFWFDVSDMPSHSSLSQHKGFASKAVAMQSLFSVMLQSLKRLKRPATSSNPLAQTPA
jgi:hypothetical protein